MLRSGLTPVKGTLRSARISTTLQLRRLFSNSDVSSKAKRIYRFNELGIGDVGLVGGKNASLGEMYSALGSKGVRVPDGFAISSPAYFEFVRSTGLGPKLEAILGKVRIDDVKDLQQRGLAARETIKSAELPAELVAEIHQAYEQLEKEYNMPNLDVAVRSSATAEDLPDASFAGQQETFLNIRGREALVQATRNCFASLFTDRAIVYRTERNFDHFKVGLSVGVQKMVQSDKACSGVMFTLDTESGFRDAVLIQSSYGLGENIVQGAVNPDEFLVHKPTLRAGFKPIIKRALGLKQQTMKYTDCFGAECFVPFRVTTKNTTTPDELRHRFSLTDSEILQLASWGCIIEDHYTGKRGRPSPMDIEWAKDGVSGELYIVQARPETVHSNKSTKQALQTWTLTAPASKLSKLVTGSSVGAKIGSGNVRVLREAKGADMASFNQGDVLVAEMTDPDWEPILRKASAVVTERGGRTCHAAIVSRELGIPCVVGAKDALTKLRTGMQVTVDCSSGEEGVVWQGLQPFKVTETKLDNVPRPKTKMMVNMGDPTQAFATSFLPNDGVGLARMEFIVANQIKIHPMAVLKPDQLDAETRAKIAELTLGYASAREFWVSKLAQGVGTLAAAFYPGKWVILRFSDFKTNEYANLLGGHPFEPKESNPMIGWRGASRYYSDGYRDGFALECEGIKRAREKFGLKNLMVMIPFCRTVEEAKLCVAEMKKHGLESGKDGLKIIGMCEIPSNVILAEQFLDVLDGFSIGSNDLTQLTLGVDRDSELVRHIYNERNPAVKRLIADVVKICRERGKYIGICGQAPSDFPDFAEFLVDLGIESMSLNPDTLLSTSALVERREQANAEKRIGVQMQTGGCASGACYRY